MTRFLGRLLVVACLPISVSAQGTTPPTPTQPFQPAELQALKQDAQRLRAADEAFDSTRAYTLAELIDYAESHNPETRVAWERAKQRATQIGIARSSLYPTLAATALLQQNRYRVLFGNAFYRQDLMVVQPVLEVTYTLFDFGTRRAGIQTAEVSLLAADLSFNDVHRRIILAVSTAYRLTSAQAQAEAAQANLTNAQTVQSSAEERLRNGLATLPDVLEARAASAQAVYELETVRGSLRIAHAQLTDALGLRPTTQLTVQSLSPAEPIGTLDSVERFIDRALVQRPDLLAQVAQIRTADAAIRAAHARYFPSVTVSANAGEQFARGVQIDNPPVSTFGETWLAQLTVSWTIFDGGSRRHTLEQARSEKRQAQAELSRLQDRVATDVWTAYSNFQTSLHRQAAAQALLTAADQSYSAALEAYQYGVKNFLDVVAAQRALAQARTTQVQSGAEVLSNLAQLAFETGDTVTPGAPLSRTGR